MNHTVLNVLIVSYARSGSSFLGDLLQSPSNSFYHFEPIHYFGDLTNLTQMKHARKMIHDFMTCDYTDWNDYFQWTLKNKDYMIMQRHKRLWTMCVKNDKSLCYNVCFHTTQCQQASVQIIKSIRLPLEQALILADEYKELNLKIIHLVRDPRGTMNSRLQKDIYRWCSKYKSCMSPRMFCSSVSIDLQQACATQQSIEDKYLLLRYEDLALDPPGVTEKIFRFLDMEVPEEVARFLDTHTHGETPAITKAWSFLLPPYQTVRNSTQAATDWYRRLNFRQIQKIQTECSDVLDKLGYGLVENKSQLSPEIVINKNWKHFDFCKKT